MTFNTLPQQQKAILWQTKNLRNGFRRFLTIDLNLELVLDNLDGLNLMVGLYLHHITSG